MVRPIEGRLVFNALNRAPFFEPVDTARTPNRKHHKVRGRTLPYPEYLMKLSVARHAHRMLLEPNTPARAAMNLRTALHIAPHRSISGAMKRISYDRMVSEANQLRYDRSINAIKSR
jgi:hypothetical protein